MKSKVIISKCSNYDQSEVDHAVEECLKDLGGIERFVTKGQRVLIKPNVLLDRPPEACVTTHPAIIKSVIKQVKKAGGHPVVGDSPGAAISGTKKVLEGTGILDAVLSESAEIVNFESESVEKKETDLSFLPYYYLSEIYKKVDVVINLPKLKTHGLVKYTGAIKNIFGLVPGMCKPDVHRNAPGVDDFTKALVEIFSDVRPALNIMDGVFGLEGNGPSGGKPRKIGYIFASKDAVALDAVCSYLIGFNVYDIRTTVYGAEKKLGEIDLERIDTNEIDLDLIRIKDYLKPSIMATQTLPPRLLRFIYKKIRTNPFVNPEKCNKCMICVKHCPEKAIYYNKDSFIFDYDKCIECFCCHELCRYNAIGLKKSLLAKIILKGR